MNDAPPDPRTAWFRRLLAVPAPPVGVARPVQDPETARRLLDALMALDADIPEATRTRFFESSGPAKATVVIWHGFTNAPSQFAAVGEALAELGYRVLVPRMPFHGLADVLNRTIRQVKDPIQANVRGAALLASAGLG